MKELGKVWNKFSGWGAHNTVLVDDSEDKTVFNPPHTSIHPQPWGVSDGNDPYNASDSLDEAAASAGACDVGLRPGSGALWRYLMRLCESVKDTSSSECSTQKFIESTPLSA
jgi:hypothetical protein